MSKWSLSEVHDYSTIRLWGLSQLAIYIENIFTDDADDEKSCQVVKN